MPRKARKGSDQTTKPRQAGNASEQGEQAVANVNTERSQSTTRGRSRSRAAENSTRSRERGSSSHRQTKQVQNDLIDVREQDDEIQVNTEAHFVKGDKFVNMAVTSPSNENLLDSHDKLSDDDVVELSHPSNDSFYENEQPEFEGIEQNVESSNQGNMPGQVTGKNKARSRSQSRSASQTRDSIVEEEDNVAQIHRIDLEMKEKLEQLHAMMAEGDLRESADMINKCSALIDKRQDKPNESGINKNCNTTIEKGNKKKGNSNNKSKSVETIYESTVPKRTSSSSEDDLMLDSSNEFNNNNLIEASKVNDLSQQISKLISDGRKSVMQHVGEAYNDKNRGREDQPAIDNQVEGGGPGEEVNNSESEEEMTAEERVRDMIQQAEAAKAHMFAATGKACKNLRTDNQLMSPTAIVDEGYIVVRAHLDDNTILNISKGEYVDFGKLLPRDRILDDEGRMEMYVHNGKTYWMPVTNVVNINNFAKWEQAFRVFSNIYCKANPHRSAELIEYNHVIHTIAMAYTWENVYTYDNEFRMHMAKFPHRSWAMILQQAWSLRLRDRIMAGQIFGNSASTSGFSNCSKVSEPCRRFNRGKCNFGATCKYEHHCSYCFKFGHGVLQCRKAQNDRGGQKNNINSDQGKKEAGSAGKTNSNGNWQKINNDLTGEGSK